MWLSNSHPATVSLDEVENILRTDRARGLTQAQAEERHNTFGYNELVGKEEDPVWKKYLEQFKNPLILLLLGSAIVSVVMGQLDDAASITLAIVIVVTVGFIQEYRLERLVTCSDFAVDESSLTGEPEPILKTVAAIVTSKESLATQEMVNQAFMGTMVVAGRATGLVTATADKTQFGQVFQVRGRGVFLRLSNLFK